MNDDAETYDGSQHDYGEWYEHDHSLFTAALVCVIALAALLFCLVGIALGAVWLYHRAIPK